jgi:TetR/AcrR family transcriptional regulator
VRDAEQSRATILDSAEHLFAERGFEAASLAEIGMAAGVSRATPSYFFGSKAKLYSAVLERAFIERDAATRQALEPLLAWTETDRAGSLARALQEAVEGYMDFLQRRPAFVRLLQREDLSGGGRLRTARRDSTAMTDGFQALRAVARQRALRQFRVDEAVMVFISLTFSPLTQRSTFMASLGRDLDDPQTRRRHVALVVDQLLHLVAG